jgi:hypothetical protein
MSSLHIEVYYVGFEVLIALKMEVVSTSETSVNLYQTTRRNISVESSSYSLP